MKTSRFFFVLLVLLASNIAFAEHNKLHDASDALRRAKATHDLADLRAARKDLEHKEGLRKEAKKTIDDAIAALEKGDRVACDKLIDEVLKDLERVVAKPDGKKKNK